MENQRILVNGVHLGVMQNGEMRNPRQTLVLLHGFTGSAANWATLLPRLAAPGRRLIALDLLGHGQADAPADPARYSLEHCQSDILALLHRLGVQSRKAMLLGYSMAGRIPADAHFPGLFPGPSLQVPH